MSISEVNYRVGMLGGIALQFDGATVTLEYLYPTKKLRRVKHKLRGKPISYKRIQRWVSKDLLEFEGKGQLTDKHALEDYIIEFLTIVAIVPETDGLSLLIHVGIGS